jgi:hypothetical protein
VMRLLQASGATAYRTDRWGRLTILADSTGLLKLAPERMTKSWKPAPSSCAMAAGR